MKITSWPRVCKDPRDNRMDEMTRLAEQHIVEWESHLRHIDEQMAQAVRAHAQGGASPEQGEQLARAKLKRDQIAQQIAQWREPGGAAAAQVVAGSGGMRTTLKLLSDEIYNALTAASKARGE